ncbi:hypothetical protein GCM10025868_09750 [Angustibacter aerolatus]|uniref:Penicillin-binding protein transpeptidase domain-containing protein n=1 Tax=Angustibacter aerolatus TaxID=1162965 RepID=A0ABQ6JC16_9ACTN|nr:hypothetical protein GCM10025868_09750 [Angustibacter aerolatus]
MSRATQGQFPAASTFKVISLPAAVQSGYDLHGTYQCGGSYEVGDRAFHNYESEAYGAIDLHRAIVVACDTIFYKFAYETWLRLGGQSATSDSKDPFVAMAKAFGLGAKTGVDLPDDSSGRIPDRQWKQDYWKATKALSLQAREDRVSRGRARRPGARPVPVAGGEGELRQRVRVPGR